MTGVVTGIAMPQGRRPIPITLADDDRAGLSPSCVSRLCWVRCRRRPAGGAPIGQKMMMRSGSSTHGKPLQAATGAKFAGRNLG